MARILVGSTAGLLEYDSAGSAGPTHHRDKNVTALAPEYPAVWTVLDRHEIWRAADGSWSHVGDVRGTEVQCLAATRAGYLVGTSEARLLRMEGDNAAPVPGFDAIEQRPQWFTPWGGPPDTRSISEDESAVFVNVHVGGILRTRDQGASWEPTIDIHADVHKVLAGPVSLYAAAARGLAVSHDQGETWEFHADGLHATYCRGVAVCGDAVLVSASTGPGGARSAIYRGDLRGHKLRRCRSGLPEWFDDNIDSLCLDALPEVGVAAFGTHDGQLFVSRDQGETWDEFASGLAGVNCVLVLP